MRLRRLIYQSLSEPQLRGLAPPSRQQFAALTGAPQVGATERDALWETISRSAAFTAEMSTMFKLVAWYF